MKQGCLCILQQKLTNLLSLLSSLLSSVGCGLSTVIDTVFCVVSIGFVFCASIHTALFTVRSRNTSLDVLQVSY